MSATLHEHSFTAVAFGNEVGEASKGSAETVVIRFAEHDKDNPFDWHPVKKW